MCDMRHDTPIWYPSSVTILVPPHVLSLFSRVLVATAGLGRQAGLTSILRMISTRVSSTRLCAPWEGASGMTHTTSWCHSFSKASACHYCALAIWKGRLARALLAQGAITKSPTWPTTKRVYVRHCQLRVFRHLQVYYKSIVGLPFTLLRPERFQRF
jgi:hypothetical protein